MRNRNGQGARLVAVLCGALSLGGCFRLSRHTTDLRALEQAALERCAASKAACAAARPCIAATLKAGRAWVDVAVQKQADTDAMADGLRPDRAPRLAKEKTALGLDEAARRSCALVGGGTDAP